MVKVKKLRIRTLSLVLILTLLCSTLLSGAVFATPKAATNSPDEVTASDGKIHLNKSAAPAAGGDRTYKVDLSVSSDSNVVVTTVPCDFVLVLDDSRSMDEMIPAKYNYTPINGNPNKDNTYYIYKDGYYQEVNYQEPDFRSDGWYCGGFRFWYWFLPPRYVYLGGSKVNYQNGGTGAGSNYEFYTRSVAPGTGIRKIDALKNAVTGFVTKVGQNSSDSRVAVISYASSSNNLTNGFIQTNASGVNRINGIINTSLYADGATYADFGMRDAFNLLKNDNPPAGTRQKVVIMFTDGEPNHGSGFDKSVANQAIDFAYQIKSTCQAKIYTVGVFGDDISDKAKTDEYMSKVSSNYSSKSLIDDRDTQPDGTGYYMECDDADQLINIFQKIASETGETLENAVIRDYIDPRFELVAGSPTANAVTGTDANGPYVQWTKTISPGTAAANGFVGSFKIRAKDEYIGGNSISTNKAQSALLTAGGSVVANFPMPTVDVPLRYAVGSMADTIYVGDSVDLNGEYVQPSDFAKQDVNISEPVWQLGTVVTPYSTADYSMAVTVAPKTGGTVQPGEYTGTAAITVLKPTIAFTDTTVFLGEDTDLSQRVQSVNWNKPGEFTKPEPLVQYDYYVNDAEVASPLSYAPTVTTDVLAKPYRIINGRKFELDLYTQYDNNPFTVNVKTGTISITKRIDSAVSPDQRFIFTIRRYEDEAKTRLTNTFYQTLSAGETKYINNLPKGTYEVTEQTGWSWRYSVANVENAESQNLGGVDECGNCICSIDLVFNNRLSNPYWMDDQDSVVNSFSLASH